MTEAEKAYAAGFFDGEGAVIIEHYIRAGLSRRLRESAGRVYQIRNWRLRVSVSQIDPAPLLWLCERYGGSIAKRKKAKHSRHDYFSWVLGSLASEAFLRDIQPYTIVKQREIQIALKFRSLIRKTSKPGLSEAELQERLSLAEQIRSRNRWADSEFMSGKKMDLNAVIESGGVQ